MVISPNKWELDVQGYLNVCNITSATPRQQIRDFAKGVNDLGLWNSMVCWPLRSSQNYGSGTTAFSLGGLGTFNGTLANGPSWGADGVFFDTYTQKIAVPITYGNKRTLFSVGKIGTGAIDTNTMLNTGPYVSGTGTVSRINYDPQNARYFFEGALSDIPVNAAFAASLDAFHAAIFSQNGDSSTIAARVDGGTWISQGSRTVQGSVSGESLQVPDANFVTTLIRTVACGAFFESALTDSESSTLYTLYKSTLGSGLGLP
jgi:hypothetical protein